MKYILGVLYKCKKHRLRFDSLKIILGKKSITVLSIDPNYYK